MNKKLYQKFNTGDYSKISIEIYVSDTGIFDVNAKPSILNDDIYKGSFEYHQSICSKDNLRFYGAEASYIKFTTTKNIQKLKGRILWVKVLVDSTTIDIGIFKVDSDSPSEDKKYRDIIAYDSLYSVLNKNLTKWYNGITFPITIKKLRDNLFKFLGITQVDRKLINDSAYIYKNQNNVEFYTSDILKDLCELNGCFCYMDSDGYIDYTFLDMDTSNAIEVDNSHIKDLKYEDYITHDIQSIKLKQNEVEEEFVYGTGENQYPISLKVLNIGAKKPILTNIAKNVLSVIKSVRFTPTDIMIPGNLAINCGTMFYYTGYDNTKIYTFVLERTFTFDSIASITDEFSSKGSEVYTRETGDGSVVYNNSQSISNLYKNSFFTYTYSNSEDYEIQYVPRQVIEFNISATDETDVIFMCTIPFYSHCDCKVKIDYYIDNYLLTDESIFKNVIQGYNIISLCNFFPIGENGRITLTVKMYIVKEEENKYNLIDRVSSIEGYISSGSYSSPKQSDKKLIIGMSDVKACVFAKGIGLEKKWDGTLNISDTVEYIDILGNNLSATVKDLVATKLQNYMGRTGTELIKSINITGTRNISFSPAKESVSVGQESKGE